MANKVVLVGLWFALSLSAAISQDVKGQTSQGTVVPSTSTTSSVQTTPNLITSSAGHNWTGVNTGALPASYMPGGPTPLYDPSTNTVTFSYNSNATVAQTIAINNALANVGAGVKINGYNYSYDIRNMNGDNRQGGVDTLNVYQSLIGTGGATLLSSQQTYNTKFEWQSVSGSRVANTPIDMANASYLKFSMVGGDNGYWGGYFGPAVRNVNMSLNYTVDQCAVNPQSSPSCPGFKTFYNISDDGYAQVNLPFTFPFYGRNFTTSYMFSNGVVGFLDPSLHGNGFCCDGVNLSSNPGSPWNFAIYALQTDLIASNPDAKFYTQSDLTYMKYTWEKINEYGTNNLNTFSATIKPTGYIGIQHHTINVQNHNVTVGIAGDISLGQYSQYYTGAGSTFTIPTSILTYTGTEVVDYCATNPLYSPTCPLYTEAMCAANQLYSTSCSGYQQAYFNQQCSLNQMYSIDCPGYAQAYLDYQCSRDQLYSTTCQGYEQAYHDQQCSLNQLYATNCPGYQQAYLNDQCSRNQLYSTQCSGYAQAYHDQQCSINQLYATDCPGYTQAYFNQQCSANPLYSVDCTGYSTAYKAQQCSLNQLYASDCPGYATAYFNQQCGLDPLYNSRCAGYEQAYFTQQCSINALHSTNCTGYDAAYQANQCSLNSLYSATCPNYATAYKEQQCSLSALYATDCPGYDAAYLTQQCSINSLHSVNCPNYATAYKDQQCLLSPLYDKTCTGYAAAYALKYIVATPTSTPVQTVSTAVAVSTTDPIASASAVVSDPVVNNVITSSASTTSAAPTSAAPVQLTQPAQSAQTMTTAGAAATEEKKRDSTSSVSTASTAQTSSMETKPSAPTARQELAAKREAQAKAKAVEEGKNLANDMGKAADMESQKQIQNVVIQAMGFTPGFDVYNKIQVPDVQGYKPFTVYKNQVNVDNARLGRRMYGPSDALHTEMINMQWVPE